MMTLATAASALPPPPAPSGARGPSVAARVGGTYVYKDGASDNKIVVGSPKGNQASVDFELAWYHDTQYGRIPNEGEATGTATLSGGVLTYADSSSGTCIITLKLRDDDMLEVRQQGQDCSGFGGGVTADGVYKRTSGASPSKPVATDPTAALGRALASTAKELGARHDAVSHAKDKAADAVALHKSLATQWSADRREFAKHLAAAKAAYQRYQSLSANPKANATPSPADLLATAKTELETAVALAKSLEEGAAKLSAAERQLDEATGAAASAALAAKDVLTSAQATVTKLDAAATATRAAAQSAKKDAAAARTASGNFDAGAHAAAKAREDADLARLDAGLASAKTGLDTASAALESTSAPQPSAGACDPKKTDWANATFGTGAGAVHLKRGKQEHPDNPDDPYTLGPVLYADLDRDGASEAYVTLTDEHGGPVYSPYAVVFVYEFDNRCQAVSLGQISGNNGGGKIVGQKYVFSEDVYANGIPTGEQTTDYALVKNQLTVVGGPR